VKKRQLKKIVSRMRRGAPARFCYNERVKAAWSARMAASSPGNPYRERDISGRPYHYDIDARGEVKPCDLWCWAFMFEFQHKWRVLQQTPIGLAMISTVFLGTDHSWGMGRPILYESMIFGGPMDQEQDRYATREEALAGHADLVARSALASRDPADPPPAADGIPF
jgi:hypothetical protein